MSSSGLLLLEKPCCRWKLSCCRQLSRMRGAMTEVQVELTLAWRKLGGPS